MKLIIATHETHNHTKREPQIYIRDEQGNNVARLDVAGRDYRKDPMEYARLFVAAPELLAELEEVVSGWKAIEEGHVRGRKLTDWEKERLAFARAAIRVARGET